MSTVRRIRYSEVFAAPNAAELLREYADECSLPQIGAANPQPDMYAALEAAGILQVFGVFHGAQLVGFASVLCSALPHYGQKVATMESIFVLPECGGGLDLMAACERHAKEMGCVAMLYSAPANGQLERLLRKRKAYQHTNTVFARNLA